MHKNEDLIENKYIFISYSHKDEEIALPIIQELQERYYVWYDSQIRVGHEWEAEIINQLSNCSLFLFFITNNSLSSSNCKDEIFTAREGNKNFINIVLTPETSFSKEFMFRYGRFQMVKYYDYDNAEAFVNSLTKLNAEWFKELEKPNVAKNIILENVEDNSNSASLQLQIKKKHKKVLPIMLIMISLIMVAAALAIWLTPNHFGIYKENNNGNVIETTTGIMEGTSSSETLETTTQTPTESTVPTATEELPKVDTNLIVNNHKLTGLYDKTVEQASIPSSVWSIEGAALRECYNLKEIELPSSLKTIGNDAFIDCDSLENIYYRGTITDWLNIQFSSESQAIMKYAKNFYILNDSGSVSFNDSNYSLLDEIVIPSGITTIEKYQFFGFSNVVSIKMDDSVTKLEAYCFANCSSLFTVYLSNNITAFDETVFNNDNNIEYSFKNSCLYLGSIDNPYLCLMDVPYKNVSEIIINTRCNYIFDNAFKDCNQLITISIPKELSIIGKSPFIGCDSLERVNYDGSILDWCNLLFDTPDQNPMCIATEFWIKKNNDYELLTQLSIPNGISKIGNYQFYGFDKIKSIEMTDDVTIISNESFSNCIELESVQLSNSINNLPNDAFSNCNLLQYYIKDNGKYISSNSIDAFYLIDVIDNTITDFNVADNCSLIGPNVFKNCSELKTIGLPSTIKVIEESSFLDCVTLKNVYYDGTAEKWCQIKFIDVFSNPVYYATNLYLNESTGLIEYNGKKYNPINNLIIPDMAKKVQESAFKDIKSIKSVELPNSIEMISGQAFEGCDSIENLYFDGTIEDWCKIVFYDKYSNPMIYTHNIYLKDESGNISFNGKKYSEISNNIDFSNQEIEINDYAFIGLNTIEKVDFTNVIKIGNYSFMECVNLIRASKISCNIGAGAFKNCTALEWLEFDEGTECINQEAFYGCSSLKKIDLPRSLRIILDYSFAYTTLEDVSIYQYVEYMSPYSFYMSTIDYLYMLTYWPANEHLGYYSNNHYAYSCPKYDLYYLELGKFEELIVIRADFYWYSAYECELLYPEFFEQFIDSECSWTSFPWLYSL